MWRLFSHISRVGGWGGRLVGANNACVEKVSQMICYYRRDV